MSLEELELLNLSGNCISALPEFLENWKSIKTLDVSFNRISSIPICFHLFFYRFERVVPLHCGPNHKKGIPGFNAECPTKELHRKYGRTIPDQIEFRWSYDIASYIDTEISYTTGMVNVGKEYWRRSDASISRLRLEGNPIVDQLPVLTGKREEWSELILSWETADAEEKLKKNRICGGQEEESVSVSAAARREKERMTHLSRKSARDEKLDGT